MERCLLESYSTRLLVSACKGEISSAKIQAKTAELHFGMEHIFDVEDDPTVPHYPEHSYVTF